MIARRHVIHVPGYDPVATERHHRRFTRELAIFDRTWTVKSGVSTAQATATGAVWNVTTHGPNWRVDTVYETFEWDDIVRTDLALPQLARLRRALPIMTEFVRTGTLARYAAASHRYALFFLAPLFELTLFAAVAIAVAIAVGGALPWPAAGQFVVMVAIAVALFVVLLHWPGHYLRLDHALSLWQFGGDYLAGRRGDVEARLDRFAARLVDVVRACAADEILIVGHSVGTLLALEIVCRALDLEPRLTDIGPRLSLLTVGTNVGKMTLHPDGSRFRAMSRRLASTPALDWVEYQARDDVISFYKFNPATLRRIVVDDFSERPLVRRVQIHDMLSPASYRRHRWRFMRVHYQFLMGNERRAAYDYFMLACGPLSLLSTARAPGGASDLLGPDGALPDVPAQ